MPAQSDDDIYVNNGADYQDTAYYPKPPADQVEEGIAEDAVISGSYPILPEIARRFEEAIADADSIDNIQTSELTINNTRLSKKVSIEVQVYAQQLLKDKLREISNDILGFSEEEK